MCWAVQVLGSMPVRGALCELNKIYIALTMQQRLANKVQGLGV